LGLDVAHDKVLALSSDGSRDTLKTAIQEMKKRWPDGRVDVAISNAGGNFHPGSFLDMDEDMFRGNFEAVTYV
jgi:NAD(P)-dependent dehydrogenase (short-subunit alcohol dehydrogenase family)